MGKKKSKSQMIFLSVLGGLGLIYILFFLAPWQNSISNLQAELITKQEEIMSETQLLAELTELQKEQIELKSYLTEWETNGPGKHQSGKLFGQITKIADQVGAKNLSLDPLQEKELKTTKSYPLLLGCRGTYREIHNLIYHIEQLPYEIWIEDVQLTPLAGDESRLQCELTLEFFVASSGNSG